MFGKLFGKKEARVFDLTPEQDEFLASAIREYNESIRANNEIFEASGFDEWSYDQYSGKFRLTKNGDTVVEADAQIIGSYDSTGKTWEWAWNNPNVEDNAKKDSSAVREYGKKEGIWYFSDGVVPVLSDEQAIYFAAVGRKLTQSEAIYPGEAGALTVYLLLKGIKRVHEGVQNSVSAQSHSAMWSSSRPSKCIASCDNVRFQFCTG